MREDHERAIGSVTREARFAKWEQTRTKGPVHYVIVYGCLGWGLLSGVAFSIVFPLVMGSGPSFGQLAPMAIPAFAIGGLLWGTVMWLQFEHEFQRSREKGGDHLDAGPQAQ